MIEEYTMSLLCQEYDIDPKIIKYVNKFESSIKNKFKEIDKIKEFNQYKVISAMKKTRLSSSDFAWSTGYGYGDIGREKVEEIYSRVFNCEDALVRPSIASGTHALNLTLSGILRPGDELLYITGPPYDTLQKIIGSKDNLTGTLIEYGISYKEVPLNEGKIDIEKSIKALNNKTKIVAIQRSTGYSDRNAFTISEIETAIDSIRKVNDKVIIMIDNCYGEFLDIIEPTDVGADIMAGSLIKNPGGGLALSGGYVVGRKDLVELVSIRNTAPGLGKDLGLTFGTSRTTLQGLFLAPHIVSEALKGSLLFATIYKSLGFKVVPDIDDERSDIIQAIELLNGERVKEFCKGIQEISAVDSYVTPEPWDMPGYEEPIIMAAGGFIEGSSIEISADGPMKEPYYVYFQGGLTYEHCKLGLYKTLDNLYKNNLINI